MNARRTGYSSKVARQTRARAGPSILRVYSRRRDRSPRIESVMWSPASIHTRDPIDRASTFAQSIPGIDRSVPSRCKGWNVASKVTQQGQQAGKKRKNLTRRHCELVKVEEVGDSSALLSVTRLSKWSKIETSGFKSHCFICSCRVVYVREPLVDRSVPKAARLRRRFVTRCARTNVGGTVDQASATTSLGQVTGMARGMHRRGGRARQDICRPCMCLPNVGIRCWSDPWQSAVHSA